MKDADYNWRVKKGERCIALDQDAKRCRCLAKIATYYHGDSEIIYAKVGWVCAAFCDEHNER